MTASTAYIAAPTDGWRTGLRRMATGWYEELLAVWADITLNSADFEALDTELRPYLDTPSPGYIRPNLIGLHLTSNPRATNIWHSEVLPRGLMLVAYTQEVVAR